MKNIPALLTALLLAGCAAGPAPRTAAVALGVPAGYALVWSDEFADDGLPDGAKWAYDTGMNKQGWHNKELQYYSAARAENAEVRQAACPARAPGAAAAGGRLGRPALHVVAPVHEGPGRVDLRLLRGAGQAALRPRQLAGDLDAHSAVVWPAGGEIDIMEHVGREARRVFSTVHTSAAHGTGQGGAVQLANACTAFHDYQMHWTPQAIRFGVDGKTHFVYQNAGTGPDRWPFDAPQFLILSIAVGGDFGGEVDDTIFPLRMEIDHVRVYQPPGAPARQAPGR